MTDTNSQEEVVAPEENEQGGDGEAEVVTLKKEEYEKLNQTLGSLKRELKDLKKPKEEPKENKIENSKSNKTEEFGLLHQTFLRSAGVIDEDEIELAKRIQKETGMDWVKVPDSKYFKLELEELRTNKANTKATSNIRGSKEPSDSKNTVEYWNSKGIPPTPADIPDRKTRAKIIRAMIASVSSSGKKFYND